MTNYLEQYGDAPPPAPLPPTTSIHPMVAMFAPALVGNVQLAPPQNGGGPPPWQQYVFSSTGAPKVSTPMKTSMPQQVSSGTNYTLWEVGFGVLALAGVWFLVK